MTAAIHADMGDGHLVRETTGGGLAGDGDFADRFNNSNLFEAIRWRCPPREKGFYLGYVSEKRRETPHSEERGL